MADIGSFAEPVDVEVSTFWRPWESTEAILGWLVLTILGAAIAVVVTWLLEQRYPAHPTRRAATPKDDGPTARVRVVFDDPVY